MSAQTNEKKKQIRCPECHMATLNTPSIIVRREKRKRENMPFKICGRCQVIIIPRKLGAKGWKLWNGTTYVDAAA